MQFRTTYLFIENYNCNVRLPMYSLVVSTLESNVLRIKLFRKT